MFDSEINELQLDDLKKQAMKCKEFILSDINLEQNFIIEEHKFEDKIKAISDLLINLKQTNLNQYHILNSLIEQICAHFDFLQNILHSEIDRELHFIRENDEMLDLLEEDFIHKDWKLVWLKKKTVSKDEKNDLRSDINILKEFRDELSSIMDLIKNDKNLIIKKEKIIGIKNDEIIFSDLNHIVDIFQDVFIFISFYKNVFDELIKKEKIFLKKVR